MIQADGLTKHYGRTVAVDTLSFDVLPGRVTGFLGPNGSGKSTTMRLMLGLDRPNAGRAMFNGTRYRDLVHPLREVGALLDAGYVHPTRKARQHLWAVAVSNGIAKARIDEVLAMVGLTEVADQRVKAYSLGMRQRLGLAAALLGDPHTLILDEPGNGLDPEGIRWIREFLAYLARQGRTIFVSSHLLSEMAMMADHLVVIGRGRLMEEGSVDDIVGRYADRFVKVRSPQADQLAAVLRQQGATVSMGDDRSLVVRRIPIERVGELAAASAVVLHELTTESGSLEDAFLNLTSSAQDYRTEAPGTAHAAVSPPLPAGAATGPAPVPPPPVHGMPLPPPTGDARPPMGEPR